jgi:hypothetical protein
LTYSYVLSFNGGYNVPTQRTFQTILAALFFLTASAVPCLGAVLKCQPLEEQSLATQTEADSCTRIEAGQYLISIAPRSATGRDDTFIITPSVTIRTRQAELIVQVAPARTQITIVSGSAIIKNTIEKHIVELQEGCVYLSEQPATNQQTAFKPLESVSNWLPLFKTSKFTTFIAMTASALPTKHHWKTALKILSPPTVLSYELGQELAQQVSLSPLQRQHFPPQGLLATPAPHSLVAQTKE